MLIFTACVDYLPPSRFIFFRFISLFLLPLSFDFRYAAAFRRSFSPFLSCCCRHYFSLFFSVIALHYYDVAADAFAD